MNRRLQFPKAQSAFHRRAQRNVFRRRDVHQQSRLFAIRDLAPRPTQTPSGFAEFVGKPPPNISPADSGTFALHTAMAK
jgi:hypothetical protein